MPRFLAAFRHATLNKRIVNAGYVDFDGQLWPILRLEDGTEIIAGRDDECNGPGVLLGPGDAELCRTQLIPSPL